MKHSKNLQHKFAAVFDAPNMIFGKTKKILLHYFVVSFLIMWAASTFLQNFHTATGRYQEFRTCKANIYKQSKYIQDEDVLMTSHSVSVFESCR